MEAESEANVIFGGNIVVKGDRDYASFGDMMVSDLKKGMDKPAFVSQNLIGFENIMKNFIMCFN